MSHCSLVCMLFSGICEYGLDVTALLWWRLSLRHNVCLSFRPESVASLLTLSPRTPLAPGLEYFEIPRTQMDQTESRPSRILPNIQPTLPTYASSPRESPDFHDPTSTSVKELLIKPMSHLSKMSIQLGNPMAQSEPAPHILHSPTNPQPTSRSLQEPFLHMPQIATTSDTKPIVRIEVAHKKEAVTMDCG